MGESLLTKKLPVGNEYFSDILISTGRFAYSPDLNGYISDDYSIIVFGITQSKDLAGAVRVLNPDAPKEIIDKWVNYISTLFDIKQIWFSIYMNDKVMHTNNIDSFLSFF